MNSFQIKVDPDGCCWLCGNLCFNIDTSETSVGSGSCLKMLFRYLNIDIGKLSHVSSSDFIERVTFCDKCDILMKEFLEWYQNLEAVRLCLGNIISNVNQILRKREDSKRQVTLGGLSEELLNSDNLRNKILSRCQDKLHSTPRVALVKVKTTHPTEVLKKTNIGGDCSVKVKTDNPTCNFCDKSFSKKYLVERHSLGRHAFLHLSPQLPPNTTKDEFENSLAYTMEKLEDKEKPLDCLFCKKPFQCRSDFQYHILKRHWKEVMDSLAAGVKLTKPVKSILSLPLGDERRNTSSKCNFCPRTFLKDWIARKHSINHHSFLHFSNLLPPNTSQDEFETSLVQTMQMHMDKEIPPNCHSCKKLFHCRKVFQCHVMKIHWSDIIHGLVTGVTLKKPIKSILSVSREERRRRIFKCEFCPKTFKREHETRRHSMYHHTFLHFSPKLPPGTTQLQFDKVVSTVMGRLNGNNKCGICKKIFLRPCFLRVHILKTHWNEVNILGEKGLDKNEDMISHKKPSSNLHVCRICQKSFKTMGFLCLHKKRHQKQSKKNLAKAKLLSERKCDKHSFTQRNVLSSRIMLCGAARQMVADTQNGYLTEKTSVDNRSSSDKNKKAYQRSKSESHKCSYCNRHFKQETGLIYHVTTAHTREVFKRVLPNMVSDCQLEAAICTLIKRSWRNHCKNKSKFCCKVCPSVSASWSLMKVHILQKHITHVVTYLS